MDAVGMRAPAEAARAVPQSRVVQSRIVVEQAGQSVRRRWFLLGHDVPQVPVEPAP